MAPAAGGWSTLQLAEFVAAVSATRDVDAAIRCAVERAADTVEAEVAAYVGDGRVLAVIGYPRGGVPEDTLVALARGDSVAVEVPGFDRCVAFVAAVEADEPGRLIVVRSGDGAFTAEEAGLLGAMARSLGQTLGFLRLIQTERSLRAASERHAEEMLRSERLRTMHVEVSRTLNETPRVTDAYRAVLDTIGSAQGWQIGELWLVDGGGDRMRRHHTWMASGVAAAEVEPLLRRECLERGQGLAGRVWSEGAVRVSDLDLDGGDGRPVRGLRRAVGVPVRKGAETTGVLVFFAESDDRPSPDLLTVLSAIGSQIGQSMARRDAERSVRESEQNFRSLFMGHPHPMWLWDEATLHFLAVNDAAVAKYGYTPEEFLRMKVTDIRAPEDAKVFLHHVRHLLRNGPAGVWKHRVKDGRVIEMEITANRQRFQGRPAVLVLAQDVTERLMLERELEHEAFHDRLTGLANRALFRDRAEQAIARAARSDHGCAVLLLDVDDFKTVNDRRGHAAGDQLLVGVARRLSDCVRPGDSIARLGGDEFGVLLEGAGEQDAAGVARRIIDALGQPFSVQGAEVFTGASVGISTSHNDAGCTPEELLRKADIAMYAAKGTGKGGWRVFDGEMHSAVSRRMELRDALRSVIADRRLVIHYQPVVDLSTGRTTGLEALLRWQHPEHGLLGPAEFVPLAEETGAIVAVGRWVLQESARQVVDWEGRVPGLRLDLSVNVSLRELQEDGYCDGVLRTLDESGLDPHRLVLEITESMLMLERDTVVAKLEELRGHGVRIAIDDFGTGYSSLTYLRHLPVDVVKIDRAFVAGVATDTEDRSLTLAIVRLLGTLDVRTVAEGIERGEQLDYVRAMGCDHGQGYLFSRPLPAADVEVYLAAEGRHAGGAAPDAVPHPAGIA